MRQIPESAFLRFLVSGALNTCITYGLYLLLNLFMDYRYAYSSAYVSGIVISYLINTGWVFRSYISVRSFLLYPSVYLLQYLAALLLLDFLVESLSMAQTLAPALVILATVPLTFFMSRTILSVGKREP